jgi:hypothetical protein
VRWKQLWKCSSGNALRQRLKKPGTKRDNKNGGRHSIISCSERGSERRSVEEVDFINATEKKIIFLMTWSLTQLRREERECTLWKISLFFLQNEILIFSLAHCFSINFHHSLQSFFKKKFDVICMMYIFTYCSHAFFNDEIKMGRLQKCETFFPTIISPVFLCQLFS